MWSRNYLTVLIGLAAMLGISGCSKPPAGHGSPRELVAKLLKAFATNDRQMWIECYEPDRKQQELAGAIFDNVRAAQVFKEAMASTGKGRWEDFEAIKIDFPVGKMVWLIPDPPSVEPNAIDQCQFKEVEGYVVVSGPGVDGILKKSGGAWYIHFPIKGGYEENWISVFTKMSKALNDHLVEAKDPKTDLTVLKRKILTEANAE